MVNITKLAAIYGDTSTNDTYLYYWALWADETGSRTVQVVANLLDTEEKLKVLITEILNDIPASLWTDADRKTFNRKTGLKRTITHTETAISEICYAATTALGGGDIKFRCRTFSESKRSKLPPLADGVEIAYRIDVPGLITTGEGENETVNLVYKPPKSLTDGTTNVIFTKTIFILNCGIENSGKYLQYFIRWVNIKHPNLSGKWTGPFGTVIG